MVCLLAVSVSADNQLKPQNTNAYGEISFFDESITVGRTNTKYGFTPYIDAEGTTYARVVVGDGTTFYTFPTAYILSNSAIYGEGQINTYVRSMTSLNSAMEAATGTNPNWNEDNIYRIEMPYSNIRFNGGTEQGFQGYDNVIEIWLQPNSHIKDQNKTLMFWKCYDLEVIHNLDTFTFRKGCLSGAFQECKSLTNLVIGYSPEVTDTGTNVFNGCTSLQSVNLFEACPNITTIGNFTFSGCTALKTIYTANLKQEGAVIIPEGVTSIGQEAFYNCDNVKYLSLPSTITYLGPSVIRDSSALEFVDFNENANAINLDNWGHFSGCSSLKAVSLPDGIKIINNRFMTSCTSLKAVYLPANLEQMNTNGNGQGPFCYSTQMYFVQEPFEVRDENGLFLGDSFVIPTKPEVYFMPSKLSAAGGNASSGTWFRDCLGLNKTIVMPTAFTKSTVVQMFRETANSSNIKNVVYLGDMESIAWSERNHHINFVFANPNDTDISSVTFPSFYNNLNSDCYFYFCSTGYRYTMGKANVEEIAATKVENSYCHISNPNKAVVTPADCINARVEVQECFCGADLGEKTIGTALGHNYDLTKGAAITDILFANGYTANGCKEIKCSRCDVKDYSTVVEALFNDVKYSVAEKGFGICVKYNVNKDAIAVCKDAGMDVSFGVVAIMADKVQGNGPLANDGKLTTEKNVVAADITAENLRAVTLRISGDENAWKANAEKAIYVLGYATDGEKLEYLGTASDAQVDRNNITSVKSIVIGEFFKFE